MRNLICIVLLAIIVSCNSQATDLNIMTYNVRYDNPDDNLNNWQYRKDVAAEMIRTYQIDLIGTQEVLVNQLNDLLERLPEFNAIGVGRQDGVEKGEYSAIFYNKERFEEIESGWFWLSETPEVAGSKGWDGACERIATWAILKEKNSGKKLFFINTHLDHIGKVARQEGVTLLLNQTKKLAKGLPIIITGDFNAEPESDVIKHVLESGEFRDSRLVSPKVSGITGTYHAFGNIPVEKRSYIDYIFMTKDFNVRSYEVLPDKLNDIFISDHAMVLSRVTLE